jgi:hypothetical protein
MNSRSSLLILFQFLLLGTDLWVRQRMYFVFSRNRRSDNRHIKRTSPIKVSKMPHCVLGHYLASQSTNTSAIPSYMQHSFKSLFKSYYTYTMSLLNLFKTTLYTACFDRHWCSKTLCGYCFSSWFTHTT